MISHSIKLGLVAVVGAAFAVSGCAAPSVSDGETDSEVESEAITNANPTIGSSFAVQINDQCTAVLLSRHYIITSAHCVFDDTFVRLRVRQTDATGKHTIYDGPVEGVLHPDCHLGTEANDIAVLRLQGEGIVEAPHTTMHTGPEKPWTSTAGVFKASGSDTEAIAPG